MTNSVVETKQKQVLTTYSVAVNWLQNNYVLCNNIVEVDESVYSNMRFQDYNEETDSYTEIFQWYLTDASEGDVEWLEKNFGLLFTYSDKLDCYVLCVDHLGTSWKYVACEVLIDDMKEIIVNRKETYKDLTGYNY